MMPATTPSVPPNHVGADDRALATAVRRALRDDVLLPDEGILATVRDGRARLEGSVRTAAQRREAEAVTARVPGIHAVDNLLQVAGPPLEADRIRREVTDLLVRLARREAESLEIRVVGDEVRIEGSLPSWGRRSAVERFVASIPGVRRVDDRTSVDPLL